ncbi:DUF4097 family beta strand repeat-containing protein [Nocardioides sp. YIM 152315]|uniref:DUF4097 family beta strand repeat-containing protein n=1 Tax=Nocardioides sp. YIM 152315 TaxID=3031760 RepID=UPI0023DA4BC9|nr:DUF4097 family beta strand repeat-containing protein [Nocardioides sp. YIM 152315]MDF1606077.1 DUF4097 family beta strand repeat-containing protein [Nocardioides sp. YIM 152315]
MTKRVAVLSMSALALSSLLLTGCGSDLFADTFEDERTETGPVSEIQVTGGSGELVVERSATASVVTIERKVRYHDDRPEDRYDELDGSVLQLNADCGDDCSIDYRITVPDEVDVVGQLGSGDFRLSDIASAEVVTGSGDISISGVAAGVVAEAGSGEVTIDDASGPVEAKTGSGDIRIEEAVGAVNAEAGSGDTTISLAMPQDVVAETSSGDLSVAVPAGTAYQVDTSVSSGDEDVAIATDPAGQHRLDLTTSSGDLSVTES